MRGTALDIFGRTEERKAERALIVEYTALMEKLAAGLNADNLEQAIALASLPEKIRGYGHVKEKAMQAYHLEKAALLNPVKTTTVIKEVTRAA